jgi:hypothetical protein
MLTDEGANVEIEMLSVLPDCGFFQSLDARALDPECASLGHGKLHQLRRNWGLVAIRAISGKGRRFKRFNDRPHVDEKIGGIT